MSPEFLRYIKNEIVPFLKDHVQAKDIESFDTTRLRYYEAIREDSDVCIVMVHGFCEFFGKYHELMYQFYHAGYSVYFLELRGHGKSERKYGILKDKIQVSSFEEYVEDLRFFIKDYVRTNPQYKKIFLFAHSMGGAVVARAIEQYPELADCAVLSSPLLKIDYGRMPEWMIAPLSVFPKIANKRQDFAFGQHSFTGEYEFEFSSASNEDRYAYQFEQRLADPDYQTWGGTWDWVLAAQEATEDISVDASKIKIPILICQAGKDTMVKSSGQEELAKKSSYVSLIRFEDSKHELFNANDETRKAYFKAMIDFYDLYRKD